MFDTQEFFTMADLLVLSIFRQSPRTIFIMLNRCSKGCIDYKNHREWIMGNGNKIITYIPLNP